MHKVASKEIDEDLSRRVVALVSQFDAQTLAVFRLYCIEGLGALETAHQCRCSKTTVLRRLNAIRAQTDVDPKHLRTLSPHLAKIETDLADCRAAHLYRKHLM